MKTKAIILAVVVTLAMTDAKTQDKTLTAR